MASAVAKLKQSYFFINHILPVVVILTILAFVQYDRRPILNVDSVRGVAVFGSVKSTDGLTVRWSIERFRPCSTIIAREIVDSVGVIHRFDAVLGPRSQAIGLDTWYTTIAIPPKIAWGPARYRATVHFLCGWSHEIWPYIEVMPEVYFTVLPDK